MDKSRPLLKKITELNRGTMKRVLNLSDVFAVGYGDLGSSIYYALGVTAAFALGATPLALGIAGIIFAFTALTYAEMSSMHMAAGGSSSFTRYAINDIVSFVAGWVLLLDFIVTIAISAFSAVPYLSYFFPVLKVKYIQILATIFIIFALFLLNFFGSKNSTKVSWILTLSTIITQIVIISIAAAFFWNFPQLYQHLKIGGGTLWSPTWLDFFKGVAMAMVAYTGIESMAQLTSETKNPSKIVPKAIVVVTVLLIFMYFLISSVALSAMTPQLLSTKFLDDPIAGIVAALPFGKKFLGPWVGVLGAVLLIVAANAGLIGASRVAFRMGEFRQVPRFLYQLHPVYKTPIVTLFLFSLLSSLIVIASRGNLNFLADLYNFGATLAFTSAHLSLLFLRVKKPEAERPFKIPFGIPIGKGRSLPISACLGMIATFSVWLSVVVFKPEGRYLGLAWLFIGIVMYFGYRKSENIDPVATLDIEKIEVPDYAELLVQKILVATRGSTDTIQIAAELASANKASLLATYIIEVPFSMSIETPLYHQMHQADLALKRAEAICREQGVDIETKVIRSRSISKAILETAKEEAVDLILLSSALSYKNRFFGNRLSIIDEVTKGAHCRVVVNYPKEKKYHHQDV